MSIFNKATFLNFGKRNYYELTENSQKIVDHVVQLINNKYNKQYISETAHGIEHDGWCNYFYIGFPDSEDRRSNPDGSMWYLIYSDADKSIASITMGQIIKNYDKAFEVEYIIDENDKGIALNEEENYISTHKFGVISLHEYYGKNEEAIKSFIPETL